jgi:hypothetical protein
MSHHGDDVSKVGGALKSLFDEMDAMDASEVAERLEKDGVGRLGPTGDFPRGRLNPGDEGEIRVAIVADKGTVVLAFGAPIEWLGCSPEEAVEIADTIKRCADEAAKWRKRG